MFIKLLLLFLFIYTIIKTVSPGCFSIMCIRVKLHHRYFIVGIFQERSEVHHVGKTRRSKCLQDILKNSDHFKPAKREKIITEQLKVSVLQENDTEILNNEARAHYCSSLLTKLNKNPQIYMKSDFRAETANWRSLSVWRWKMVSSGFDAFSSNISSSSTDQPAAARHAGKHGMGRIHKGGTEGGFSYY